LLVAATTPKNELPFSGKGESNFDFETSEEPTAATTQLKET
jgi:hypothetical protein